MRKIPHLEAVYGLCCDAEETGQVKPMRRRKVGKYLVIQIWSSKAIKVVFYLGDTESISHSHDSHAGYTLFCSCCVNTK